MNHFEGGRKRNIIKAQGMIYIGWKTVLKDVRFLLEGHFNRVLSSVFSALLYIMYNTEGVRTEVALF